MGRLLDVAEALQHVDLGARDEVYHACRALLVHRREDLGDVRSGLRRLLARARQRLAASRPTARARATGRRSPARRRPAPSRCSGVSAGRHGDRAPSGVLQTWSDARTLAHKDFARVHARGDGPGPGRAGSPGLDPWRAADAPLGAGRGPRIDLRRALAASVRTGGDVVALPTPPTPGAAAADGPAVRRQRLDGALLAHAPAFHPRPRPPAPAASRRSSSPPA